MKSILTALLASLLFAVTPAFAEGEPDVTTEAAPPSGDVVFSHYDDSESGGWGWYNLPAVYRHVAQTFRVPADAEMTKVTFLVRRMAGGAIQDQPYTLSLIEQESPSQKPGDGKVVATFDGLMTLNEDRNFYLTFTLPSAVALRSDLTYFITLEWRNPQTSNHVELAVLNGYRAGTIWENTDKTGDEYKRITDSNLPGLIFFLH